MSSLMTPRRSRKRKKARTAQATIRTLPSAERLISRCRRTRVRCFSSSPFLTIPGLRRRPLSIRSQTAQRLLL